MAHVEVKDSQAIEHGHWNPSLSGLCGKPTHIRFMRRQIRLLFSRVHELDRDPLPISHIRYVRSEDGAVR
jgi:hypothetical protein